MQLVFNYSDSHRNTDIVFQKLDEHGNVWQENEEKQILSNLSVAWLHRSTLDDDGNLRVYHFQEGMDGWAVVRLVLGFRPNEDSEY